MIEYKAPQYIDTSNAAWAKNVYVFLGGSIEMGTAEQWQDIIVQAFKDVPNVVFLNPRRDDWDSTWTQDPTPGTQFHEQVTWEMDAQEFSDILIYYFADDTKSPITLLELGAYGGGDQTIVRCTPKFWRYGNVAMFSNRYGCTPTDTIEDVIRELHIEIEKSKRFKGIK